MKRWSNFAEFIGAVIRAGRDRMVDPRLTVHAAAPTTQSQEGSGADGGYAVVPDFRSQVMSLVWDQSLLPLTDLRRTSSNSLTIPADKTPPWAATGPQVSLEQEGNALAQSRLKLEANALRLSRAQVLLPISDEMLEDAPGLSAYLETVVPQRFAHKLNDWLVNGDGVSKPLGLMNAGAKLMQTKETQSAATIVLANTQKMLTRLPGSSQATAVWLAHPEAQPQLSALGVPHYVNGVPGQRPTLHGLPVYYLEVCAPLGTEGDLILWDPRGYLSAVRAYANAANDIRQDVSLEAAFDQMVGMVRLSMRIAGSPWVSAPWTRYRTATTVSHVVTLEAR